MGANILPKLFFIGMMLALVMLAACGSPTPRAEPTAAPTTIAPQVVTTQTTQPPNNPTFPPSTVAGTVAVVTTQPPNNPSALSPTAVNDSTIPSGITAEGYYFLGNPDAKVTLIDYSDFL